MMLQLSFQTRNDVPVVFHDKHIEEMSQHRREYHLKNSIENKVLIRSMLSPFLLHRKVEYMKHKRWVERLGNNYTRLPHNRVVEIGK